MANSINIEQERTNRAVNSENMYIRDKDLYNISDDGHNSDHYPYKTIVYQQNVEKHQQHQNRDIAGRSHFS